MRFHPLVPNRLFECNDGGLYYSDDHGNTWMDISNGLEISQIYRISTASMNQGNVLCGLQDNGTKEIYNGVWDDRTGGDGMHCIIDYNNNQVQCSSVQNGKLYKTENQWVSRSTIVLNNGSGVNAFSSWVTPYDLNPSNPQELIIGKDEVYKSTDGGFNWNQLGIYPGTAQIDLVYYAPSDPNVIYVSEGTNVVRSDDGGQTWNTVTTGLLQVSSLAIHPTDPMKVWMTKSSFSATDKVSYSSDGGMTWTSITGSLPGVGVNTIVYEPNSSNGLYIGTDIGVYYKNDNLPDWIPFDNGLPNTIVNDLKFSEADGMLYAGTYGRGLWKSGPHQILSADFSTAYTTLCETTCIDFTDNSIGATSWQWNFPGASPSTSTAQNPSGICYSKEGYYPVNLIASNSSGSDSKTKVSYIHVEVCASLDTPIKQDEVRIYPNPIDDEVWVEFESLGGDETTVRILDLSGKVLYEQSQKTTNGLQQLRIDFEEFKKGIYFIELEINDSKTVKKTVKK
ncbi:MAG TPA: hypothetical protein DDX92_01405 [Flavobacteriales bacterium]|jgi:photosystem II stability/assembly factor-like uncharacterized protein|nr:hypothetical protein [Flavobacteriales bacterium]